MSKSTTPTNAVRRVELPLAGRPMALRGFTRAAAEAGGANGTLPSLATAEIVFSAGAAVKRYDWFRERYYLEQLVVEEGAVRMERLERGAPLLNTHSSWDLEDQLGVVEKPEIRGGVGVVQATFSRRESVAGYVQDVEDGILRNVSVGYVRHRVEMVPPESEGGLWIYRVVDWEPMEVSLVPIPADMDAQVVRGAGLAGAEAAQRSASESQPSDEGQALRVFPCEFVEVRRETGAGVPESGARSVSPTAGMSAGLQPKERLMDEENQNAAGGTSAGQGTSVAVAAPVQQDAQRTSDAAAVVAQRAADITDLCARHGVAHLAAGLIRGGNSVDQARGAVLEELARRDTAAGGHRNVGRVETVRDEMEVRLAGIEQAILHRIAAGTQLDDNGRQYRGMSLLEIGRDYLEAQGVRTRGMDRLTLATQMLTFRSGGMLGTSDFSSLFANVANKRMRSAYEENEGTYALWARRAPNAPDFKSMSVVQLSGAPDLLQTNEHGEFKYGKMTDGAETYAVLTYGRIVSLTRQAIVNDDLRAFERMVTAFGFAARRLENRTVYAQLTANAALADGVALFHADHGNLGTGAGSALSFDALKAGRTAMRVQKGLAKEELNLAPSYLVVPAALEQTAYQLTSSNYTPSTKAEVNEFRAGGRTALTPIVEPILDGSSAKAWYLAAATSQVDTVEYCYLDGAEGPVIESQAGFETDGVNWKCRLDFAAKAIDSRGLYKGAGE